MLWAKNISTITILLVNELSIRLKEVVYAPDYDFNLISLNQFRENNITFINNENYMRLMQGGQEIAWAKKIRNFFILDLALPNKAMQISLLAIATKRHEKPTHLVSWNKWVQVWY